MTSRADRLREALLGLKIRVGEIRALSLVDNEGLPLVSTLGAGSLDEALAGFGGAARRQMERAGRDFELGPVYLSHFIGRDRQLFAAPLNSDMTLVAMVDAHATPATIAVHLLALARDILAAETPE